MPRIVVLLLLGLVLIAGVWKLRRQARPAPTPAPAEAIDEPAGLAPAPMWDLRSEEAGNGTRYLARSRVGGPVEVDCALSRADNVESDPQLPRRLVLGAQGEREIATVHSASSPCSTSVRIFCARSSCDSRPAASALPTTATAGRQVAHWLASSSTLRWAVSAWTR